MSEKPTDTAEPEIVFGFGGRALRRINPNRLFKSGDSLVNRAGQALWEVVSFNPKGVRVLNWPHGNPVDYLNFYGIRHKHRNQEPPQRKPAEPAGENRSR
jgi:hypothetical protein